MTEPDPVLTDEQQAALDAAILAKSRWDRLGDSLLDAHTTMMQIFMEESWKPLGYTSAQACWKDLLGGISYDEKYIIESLVKLKNRTPPERAIVSISVLAAEYVEWKRLVQIRNANIIVGDMEIPTTAELAVSDFVYDAAVEAIAELYGELYGS